MAYDDSVAERVRQVLKRRRGISERKMFGGLAFLMNGNMCCGVLDKDIVVRLGDKGAASALGEAHTRPMDFTGRPMKSMVYIKPAGYRSEKALRGWIERAVEFTKTLPEK